MYRWRVITPVLLAAIWLTLSITVLAEPSKEDVIVETKGTATQVVTSDTTPIDNSNAEVNDVVFESNKQKNDGIVVLELDLEDADMKELSGKTSTSNPSVVTSSPGDDLYRKALDLLEPIPVRPEVSIPMHRRRRGNNSGVSGLPQQLETIWRSITNGIFRFMYFFSDEVKPSNTEGTKGDQVNYGRTPERRQIPQVEDAIKLLDEASSRYNHADSLFLLGELYFHGLYAKQRDFTQALVYYKQLADINGNATAQQRTGFIYSLGLGKTVQDARKSLLYTTFAGISGDTVAEMTLGYRYLHGIGVPKSCEESVFYYQRVADKAIEYFESGPPGGRRLPRIRMRLADEEGGVFGIKSTSQTANGVELDEVLEYYRLAAEKGDLQAKLLLGQLYHRGSNRIKQDFRRAKRYYQSVALHVYSSNGKQKRTKNVDEHVAFLAAQAAGLIGEMYWRGEGVKANNLIALRWFKHAIEYDDPIAFNALGVMYRDGTVVKKDITLAIKYFKKAASGGNDEAQVNLGKIMFARKSYSEARYFFNEAANRGNILGQYYLADMHWEALGTSYSCPLAVAYYKIVAEKGDWQYSPIPAGYQAYKRGDYETALLVYLQAAEMGYEVAQTNAAWLLDKQRHGQLEMTPTYEQVALSQWMRAANQGSTDARVKSGDYYYKGIGTPQDAKQAAKCYHSVARNDISDLAMWNLGWMHEHGVGVNKDFYLARRWYMRALEINPNAYFPVLASIVKLYVHWTWNWITRLEFLGKFSLSSSSSSSSSSSHKGGKSLHKDGKTSSGRGAPGGATGMLDDEDEAEFMDDMDYEDDDIFSEKLAWEEPEDLVNIEDELINGWDWRRGGADSSRSNSDEDEHDDYSGGADDGFRTRDATRRARKLIDQTSYEDDEDSWIDNLVIIAMCILVGWMVYVRQFRMDVGNNAERERERGGGGGAAGNRRAFPMMPVADQRPNNDNNNNEDEVNGQTSARDTQSIRQSYTNNQHQNEHLSTRRTSTAVPSSSSTLSTDIDEANESSSHNTDTDSIAGESHQSHYSRSGNAINPSEETSTALPSTSRSHKEEATAAEDNETQGTL